MVASAAPGLCGFRILLTGASGFVGAALLPRLSAAGAQITTLGRGLAPALPGVESVAVDLGRAGSLHDVLERLRKGPRFDAIVHLAVSRHHRDFPARALDMFQVNSAAAAELLDFARATGVGRAVFGSTGSVYSATTATAVGAPGNHEGEFRKPNSYFAASKLFADALCDLYRGHLSIATLRLYAPYGPGLSDRMLTDLAARVRDGRPLSLPANGTGLAFAALYVDDATAVIEHALRAGWNETVNVAAPEVWTIESVGRLLGELLGREPAYERSASPTAPRVIPDTERLHALLPQYAFTGLREGLRAMLRVS